MSYRRVIPRDLFNEANLLKMLGKLWIALDDARSHAAVLSEGDGSPFKIEQDESDGSISAPGLPLTIKGQRWVLARPLNSRDLWPLYARRHDEEVSVFTEDGDLTDEFRALIGLP